MEEFIIQCPTCGFSFSVDESCVGVATTCASCSNEFTIESPKEGESRTLVSPMRQRPDQILVTSCNLTAQYQVMGMVCFTIGTRGELKNLFDNLKGMVSHRLAKGQISETKGMGQIIGGLAVDSAGDLLAAAQYSGASFRSSDMEIAFHIAVNQLQLRASYLQADAVIGFRYDIDFDSNANVLNFMATAYGTAVRLNK
jgi:uncharacterized protein YbjQ (UPF0145 family)